MTSPDRAMTTPDDVEIRARRTLNCPLFIVGAEGLEPPTFAL